MGESLDALRMTALGMKTRFAHMLCPHPIQSVRFRLRSSRAYTVDELTMHEAAHNRAGMASDRSWILERIELALREGLVRAYDSIKVDPAEYLVDLRSAHGLTVESYDGMFALPVNRLDYIAEQTIRSGMKIAAAQGAGLGVGGLLTVVPDMGMLAAITMRTVQKLSLVYGFPYNTDEEVADLWIAAASAAGVDISRELLERTILRRFVARVIQRIAASASTEVAEKMVARAVPLVSSVMGAAMNYYFVRAWSRRAMVHFRERHLAEREWREAAQRQLLPGAPPIADFT